MDYWGRGFSTRTWKFGSKFRGVCFKNSMYFVLLFQFLCHLKWGLQIWHHFAFCHCSYYSQIDIKDSSHPDNTKSVVCLLPRGHTKSQSTVLYLMTGVGKSNLKKKILWWPKTFILIIYQPVWIFKKGYIHGKWAQMIRNTSLIFERYFQTDFQTNYSGIIFDLRKDRRRSSRVVAIKII